MLLAVPVAFLLVSCAKQGYPGGGPRDVTPPAVVSMHPASATTHFSARTFRINFDEFIVLNDADNNIIVSPPVRPKPQYSVKGKSLVVQLPDTLQPGVTYLFQMHGAVADFTEGNRIGPLEYAFSTGALIDSLSLQGRVVDAYLDKPYGKTVTVMLYRHTADSLWSDSTVTLSPPSYVARCNADGTFRFNYMADGLYRIVAIDDADRNLRYNGNEAVASLDTLLRPVHIPAGAAAPPDTSRPGLTLRISCDSSQIVQRVTKSDFVAPGRIVVATAGPMQQPRLLCDDSLVWRLTPGADTLHIWMRRPGCNSTVLRLCDASGLDDTLKLQLRKKTSARRRQADAAPADAEPSFALHFQFGQTAGVFDTLSLTSVNPVVHSSDTALQLLNLADSVRTSLPLRFDSLGLRARIDTVLSAGCKYQLTVPAGALVDLWGGKNAELTASVDIQGEERYGNIFLTCQGPLPPNTVVQLTDEQGRVRLSQPWPDSIPRIAFKNLSPGKYRIQAFGDLDSNGRWTPGSYWLHRQPEPVYRFEKTFDVRENWDIEETWQMLR
ncbi:MAG: lipoprotein [bacterium P3]|nr:MAG: lipoprotein [bacterium P3]KWW40086.1 MAG: lipoprotein [bacterium F083]